MTRAGAARAFILVRRSETGLPAPASAKFMFNHERAAREEYCERAYHLAAYILGDFAAAERVATKAVDALELQLQQEWERRVGTRSHRWYKICPNRDFMLHRLVWAYCLPVEREQEQDYREGARPLDNETMLIRFVKEILDDAFARNSFHLLVGLFRVLASYTTRDAQRLYELLSPDGDGGPDDYSYRRDKRRYMKMLAERFPGFLQIINTQGEDRFLKKETSGDSLRLVEEALNLFTPLKPRCLTLPDEFDPTDDVIEELLSPVSNNPRADFRTQREMEYDVEQLRMHSLTHAPCRSKVLGASDLPELSNHLEIPEFSLDRSGGGVGPPPLDRRDIPALSEEQKRRMNLTLHERRGRRQSAPPDELVVSVDGVERGVLSLDAAKKLRLALESRDRVIEFTGRDAGGGVLLGTHLLQWADCAGLTGPEAYRFALRDRRKVEVEFSYLRREDELTGAVAEISYKRGLSPWVLPVAVGALLLTASTSLLIFRYSRKAGASE